MALPHFPTKYGSPAIITARQSIEHGHPSRPLPECPPDLILLFQKSLWRELNAAAVRKETGDRAPFIVLDRGDAPVAVAGGFGVGAPAAAEARADPELLDVCRRGLTAAEIDAVRGRSWTTDDPHVREQLRAVFDVTVATLARSTADALPVTPHVRQTP